MVCFCCKPYVSFIFSPLLACNPSRLHNDLSSLDIFLLFVDFQVYTSRQCSNFYTVGTIVLILQICFKLLFRSSSSLKVGSSNLCEIVREVGENGNNKDEQNYRGTIMQRHVQPKLELTILVVVSNQNVSHRLIYTKNYQSKLETFFPPLFYEYW